MITVQHMKETTTPLDAPVHTVCVIDHTVDGRLVAVECPTSTDTETATLDPLTGRVWCPTCGLALWVRFDDHTYPCDVTEVVA